MTPFIPSPQASRSSHTLLGVLLLLVGLGLAPSLTSAAPSHSSVEACARALGEASPPLDTTLPPLIRIVSWNAMKYSREGSAALLARLTADADFVALQEGVLSREPARPSLEYRYFADGYVSDGQQTGVELRSRWPAAFTCTLTHREPWLRTPKAVLAARYAFADHDLLIVTLHAINFTFGVSDLREQFAAVGRLLTAHAGPALVVGDFNNWNRWRQSVIDNFARDFGLEIGKFEPDLRSRHLGKPVDGLLQRGFDTLSTSAIPTTASDHHPVLALLRPSEPRAPAADSRAADAEPRPGP